ncbi:MAG: LLM class F420-dependent oxidoreductase [Actinobacteria bacterium]|nr:LLM class F420-dependent oxidoreductase [Actinomycetota bacterium]MCL6104338.1 LLM class F420-dependent oxidoreductase [Actinomycetota bacterium]
MKLGLVVFPTEYSMGIVELATAAEERGFESLFLPEHSHIPTSRLSPYMGGIELPKEYLHIMDPFVSLAACAAATKSLLLATGICLIIQRDVIQLAKEVATLDQLSGGRVLLGIGAGWNEEEMRNHGIDPSKRWKIMAEKAKALKLIWTEEEAEFHGQFVNFDPIWCWPKPLQKGGPPILVGGNAKTVYNKVVEYGDGWMPNVGLSQKPLGPKVAQLQELARNKGREKIPVTAFGVIGTCEIVDNLAENGAERVVLWIPTGSRDEVLTLLDNYAILVNR